MLDQINLKEKTLKWFARKQFRSKTRGTLWPSEASVEYTNPWGETEVLGKCARAVYYRIKGIEPTNPPDAKSQIIFLLGHQVEAAVTEAWKQMGIWENNSVRWEDKDRNLSGEFDVILREGDQLYGVECKSFYGYYANKQILGHWEGRGRNKRFIKGRPKDEHLMQAALYCAHTRGTLAGFKIFYVSRDATDMGEFDITVDDKGTIYIDGVAETRFTINDIYDRYANVNEYVKNDELPEKDFEYKPSDERVEELAQRGVVSATALKNHQSKKQSYRDWHCSYCNYRDYCQNNMSEENAIKHEEETAENTSMDDIMNHGSF